MPRIATLFVILAAVLGVAAFAAGCGGEEEQSATPETVGGSRRPRPPTRRRPTPRRRRPTRPRRRRRRDRDGDDDRDTSAAEGDPVAGKEVFLGAAACGGCHTLADAGTSGQVGPNLDDTQPSADLVVERVTNGLGAMPSFSSTLSEQQIADVAAYVSSVAGS